MKHYFLFIAIVFFAYHSISAQIHLNNETLAKFDKELSEKLPENAPGTSVIILSKDSVIFENYYGFFDIEKGIKLSKEHQMGIASMSKQFLGMSLLFLLEEGKISLEDNISEYFPELPINERKISIRQLVSHVSGLPELTQNENFMDHLNEKHSVKEIIDLAFTGEFRSEPGEKFLYCNTGYTIAVALIEKVSGMPFSSYLKEKIFEPLKMIHTYSCDYKHDAVNIAKRYTKDSLSYKEAREMHFSNLIGGGGIISNVTDFAKWSKALMTGENLPYDYETIWSSGYLNDGEKTDYGLGIGISSHNNHVFYYHPGMGDGMNSVNLIFPEEEIAIVVIRNISKPDFSSVEIALSAADMIFGV